MYLKIEVLIHNDNVTIRRGLNDFLRIENSPGHLGVISLFFLRLTLCRDQEGAMQCWNYLSSQIFDFHPVIDPWFYYSLGSPILILRVSHGFSRLTNFLEFLFFQKFMRCINNRYFLDVLRNSENRSYCYVSQ